MFKYYLFTPGPTPVPPKTSLAMAAPIIHHRSPQFATVLAEVKENLKYVFQTQNDVLILASSGTGGMEGVVTNTLSPGDKALVVRAGKFGERWAEICKAYGVEVLNIDVEWGRCVKAEQIAHGLDKNPEIKAVFVQAHETSTGVKFPLKEIAEVVKKRETTILVVDAISALGAMEIKTDEWGLDVVVGGSQKALMLPPGLAFVCLNERAWRFVEESRLPKYYFDFSKEKKSLEKNQTAYTPAVSLIIGLRENLRQIKQIGLENIVKYHQRLSDGVKMAVKAMGLSIFTKENPSEVLTAVEAPKGIDAQMIVKKLREEYGITIAGGQSQLKGRIFRISHMGYVDEHEMVMTIAALERVLIELGYELIPGTGVKAIQQILLQK
ncbi:MAG TPA: alanine--glyoxylate aminotransferase family protein [Candidatus Desulfofervidus auxilii]|uniref:Alanine--glyoxylate aminotransferase family protein n=1 Tax=Desulfofervidus auxilii TaxID=1621989 RepID=A0A7C1VPR3_DESA2|nr:alanine--glyoxylate aminotransferase family protein [Candidatus Desulfofervidus auxilii]